MPLPAYGDVTFEKPPLRLVLAQIRFPLLFRFSEKPFLAPFHEAIREAYPQASWEGTAGVGLSSGGTEVGGEGCWRFGDAAGGWSVLLGEDSLTLLCHGYTSFEPLLDRFEHLLGAAALLGVVERARLGLRFVNELRVEGADRLADWSVLLNPDLVGPGGEVAREVEHSFQELRLAREDGIFVVRHGLRQGTSADRGREAARRGDPFYLLDLDYADPTEGPLELGAASDQLRSFHESIYRFFRWSLDGGALFAQFGPSAGGVVYAPITGRTRGASRVREPSAASAARQIEAPAPGVSSPSPARTPRPATELRLLSGLPTTELAKIFGVSRVAYGKWERDTTPRAAMFEFLTEVLAQIRGASEEMSPAEKLADWLRTPVEAGGKRPIDYLAEKRFSIFRGLVINARPSRYEFSTPIPTGFVTKKMSREEFRRAVERLSPTPRTEDDEEDIGDYP